MALFLLEVNNAGTLKANKMVVSAADAADAKAFCKSQFGGEGGDWDNAIVTALVDVASSADDSLIGWRFHILVSDPITNAIVAEVTVVGTASLDTIDTIGAALVTALEATANIADATYLANTLTVAAISDDIGDHNLIVEVFPPIINNAGGVRENEDVAIPGYVGTITDEGIAAAVLEVDFAADAYIRPTLYRRVLGVTA